MSEEPVTKRHYLALEQQLNQVRHKHNGGESDEEKELLELMDSVWHKLPKRDKDDLLPSGDASMILAALRAWVPQLV